MKRVELASSAVCRFCFNTIPARAWVYLQDDCTIECAGCHQEAQRAKDAREHQARRAPLPQLDLFGGNDGS